MNQLLDKTLWWTGPEWLKQRDVNYRDNDIEPNKNDDAVKENMAVVEITSLLNSKGSKEMEILEIKNHSDLSRMLRITAWVRRFINNAREKAKSTGTLTAGEIAEAELYWIRLTQNQSFYEEINQLKRGKEVNFQSKIKSLSPFLDDSGVLRVGGRLQMTGLKFEQKHPCILPANYMFSELIVRKCHQQVLHSGLQDTLNQARERFWIMKGRQLTKRVVHACLICRKYKAKPAQQISAPLPAQRIEEAPPFEITGVDFAGPMYSKNQGKCYIALFTCAVTRAIHLELVTDLTTEKFLLAFRRFVSRRGLCTTIYSDNAKTFKRANKELTALWDSLSSKELQEFFAEKRIIWKFIAERAAWWGGMWERMVRSVKTCLRKVLGKSCLKYEEIETILIEVEAVVNSRPITFTHTSSEEPVPLTPSHFLIGQRLTALPSAGNVTAAAPNTDQRQLNKRWKYRQRLINTYWTRWKKEYLLELRSAHCSSHVKRCTELKLGDVILVNEDKLPKHLWKMGRIKEVYIGRDGKVRSCLVMLPSRNLIRRPVQLLYPLELNV